MEQREELDLRRCDAVWQRVAPELNPYPEVRAAAEKDVLREARTRMVPLRKSGDEFTPAALAATVEEELAARRDYLVYARGAGVAARTLTQLAAACTRHAGRMRSLYFLLTGECYRPVAMCGQDEVLSLCQFLRARYGAAVEKAAQMDGWADDMPDRCMAAVVRTIAGEKRCQAVALMGLLEGRIG